MLKFKMFRESKVIFVQAIFRPDYKIIYIQSKDNQLYPSLHEVSLSNTIVYIYALKAAEIWEQTLIQECKQV